MVNEVPDIGRSEVVVIRVGVGDDWLCGYDSTEFAQEEGTVQLVSSRGERI